MPAAARGGVMRVPGAIREDGEVYYRDYRQTPHALNVVAT